MNFKLKTPPATEPTDLETAKSHLLVTNTNQDDYISSLITVAREWIEEYTGRPLITQVWIAKGARFASRIDLLANLQSVASIKYLDSEKVQQTLNSDDYVVVDGSLIGSIFCAYGASWPTVYQHQQAIEIEFTCGYGSAELVPKPIVQAILLLVGHFYENRETTSPLTIKEVPMTVEALLNPYQIPVIR